MSAQHREPVRAADGPRRPTVPTALFTPASFAPAPAPAPAPTTPPAPTPAPTPPAPNSTAGQLAWDATETAPVAWVPFVYTEAEERTIRVRRRLSVTSIVLGILGLAGALIGVFGLPFSTGAIGCAVAARFTERRAGTLWIIGFVTGLVGLLIGVGWLALISRVVVPLL